GRFVGSQAPRRGQSGCSATTHHCAATERPSSAAQSLGNAPHKVLAIDGAAPRSCRRSKPRVAAGSALWVTQWSRVHRPARALLSGSGMTTCSQPGTSGRAPRTRPAVRATRHLPYHRAVPGGPMTREQLFLSELALIERVIAWVCARRCLRGADGEDFASTVKLRLIENDYEILGRFEGRSSLKTYITAVVNHLYLDFQTQRFGKWRPS